MGERVHPMLFRWSTTNIPSRLDYERGLPFSLGAQELSKNEPNKMIVLECLFLTIAPCDAAEPWQLGSQDAATPMMQGIIDLHHDIFFFLILIFVFVSWILVRALWHFHYKKNPIPQRIVHGTTIEILWTIFPSIILMFIAIPSFALLYSMDEVVVDPAITIKAIGHQWYWTYEYSDYNSSDEQSLTFDSYTIPEDDPELGQSRLLEVDNRVVVPEKTHLRIIVTPADVPHSWAVPSLGVKCDAVPGRLNQTSISVQREGVYYGQCSEICGTNHAFMRAPGNIGRLLSPLWLSRTTQGASHPRSKLLQRAAGAVWSRGARQKDYASRVSNQLIPLTGGASPIFIPSPKERPTILYGLPVPANKIWEVLSSPFYIGRSDVVHIPGEDPLIDINLPPAAAEPEPNPYSGLSKVQLQEELRKTVKQLRVHQGNLSYWENVLESERRRDMERLEKHRLLDLRLQEQFRSYLISRRRLEIQSYWISRSIRKLAR
ncbi:cytochrome c oxidase subunit 2 [Orobanche hederae]